MGLRNSCLNWARMFLEVPTVKIELPTHRDAFVDALLELNAYDWLVFTSANSVTAFFDLFAGVSICATSAARASRPSARRRRRSCAKLSAGGFDAGSRQRKKTCGGVRKI